MATYEETQRYCPSCARNVLARRRGTNHVLHLLLTMFTMGLWLLVWMGQSVRFGGWRCSQCGHAKLEGPRALQAKQSS